MKIVKKVSLIICIMLILQITVLVNISNVTIATGGDELFSNMSGKVSTWENMGQNQLAGVGVDTSSLLSPVLAVAQIIYWVGCVVVIIITILHFVGLMSKDGEKKSIANKRNLGWLITSVVLIAAPQVWGAIVNALDSSVVV